MSFQLPMRRFSSTNNMKPKPATKSELQAALSDLLECSIQCDEVPEGWKTTIQWAAETGKSRARVTEKIKALVESGKWEKRPFMVKSGDRAIRVPHYRKIPG